MTGWIEYDSNNSGGSFWLTDDDWKSLEEAGWTVGWIMAVQHDHSQYGGGKEDVSTESGRCYAKTKEEAFSPPPAIGSKRWPDSKSSNDDIVVATASTYAEAVELRKKYGGYFGCLAVTAVKAGENADKLISEFERVANQDASDEGCNCCGAPHSFTWNDDSGESKHASVQVTETKLVWT